MGPRIFRHWAARGLVLAHLSSAAASALVKFNEGRDQIFVNASVSAGYDSNIYASGANENDIVTNTTLSLDYNRNAGMIAVSGTLGWNLGTFATNGDSDFANPSLSLGFTKSGGRTTGGLSIDVSRESEADPNVNLRTESWRYNVGLDWKYPVIERYSLSGEFGYSLTDYVDNSAGFIDLDTYSAGVNVNYAYSSTRELSLGYRIRESDTSAGGSTTDHSITAGLSGRILPKLNGSLRGGYQIREDSVTGESYGSPNAEISLSWAATRRMSVTLAVTKDFSTTATESSLDSTQATLSAQYSLTRRFNVTGAAGGGESRFFSGSDDGRTDRFANVSTGLTCTINEHLSTSLAYSYFKNWSNRANSDFDRHSVNLNLSTHW